MPSVLQHGSGAGLPAIRFDADIALLVEGESTGRLYMLIDGEDQVGFRCLAQRSRLADGVKDNGVVSMFPPLAEEWWAQVRDQTPWKNLGSEDFSRLKNKYGVSWVVVQQPGVEGLDCVYQNSAARVCRIP